MPYFLYFDNTQGCWCIGPKAGAGVGISTEHRPSLWRHSAAVALTVAVHAPFTGSSALCVLAIGALIVFCMRGSCSAPLEGR